jgi:tetratricopeptide (TPR) repeat protein
MPWLYRPLLYATYYFERTLWGISAQPMRFLNFFIHFFNIYLCLRIFVLFSEQKKRISLFLIILIASLHPIAWHSIVYLSARSTLLVTTFILIFILDWRKHYKFTLISFFAFAAAVFTKETGLLCLLVPLLFKTKQKNHPTSSTGALLFPYWKSTFLFTSVLLILFRLPTFISFTSRWSKQKEFAYDYLPYLATQFIVICKYLWTLLINPFSWSFYSFTTPVRSFIEPRFLASLFILLSLALLLFYIRRWRGAPLAYFFMLSFLPEMFFPRELIGTEQRVYLPLLLFALLFGLISDQFLLKKKWKKTLFYLLIPSFLVLTFISSYQRVRLYQNLNSLLEHDLKNNPQNLDASLLLISNLIFNNQFKTAFEQFDKVEQFSKPVLEVSSWQRSNYSKLIYLIGLARLNLGQDEKVEALIKQCYQLAEQADSCEQLEAEFLIIKNEYKKAENILLRNKTISPSGLEILARLYTKSSDFTKAIAAVDQLFNASQPTPSLFLLKAEIFIRRNSPQKALDVLLEAQAYYKNIDSRNEQFFKTRYEDLKNHYLNKY